MTSKGTPFSVFQEKFDSLYEVVQTMCVNAGRVEVLKTHPNHTNAARFDIRYFVRRDNQFVLDDSVLPWANGHTPEAALAEALGFIADRHPRKLGSPPLRKKCLLLPWYSILAFSHRGAERCEVRRALGGPHDWELQRRLIGTYHGVSRYQLQVYLDEFALSKMLIAPVTGPAEFGVICHKLVEMALRISAIIGRSRTALRSRTHLWFLSQKCNASFAAV